MSYVDNAIQNFRLIAFLPLAVVKHVNNVNKTLYGFHTIGGLFSRIMILQIFTDPQKCLSSKFFAETSWYSQRHVCVYLSCFDARLRLHYQHLSVG